MYLSIYVYFYLCIYFYLSFYLSIFLSIYIYIYLSSEEEYPEDTDTPNVLPILQRGQFSKPTSKYIFKNYLGYKDDYSLKNSYSFSLL